MITKGTFKQGKMFYENADKTGRWAKVMVVRFSTIPDLITVALGDAGQLRAWESVDCRKLIDAKEYAVEWVTEARC